LFADYETVTLIIQFNSIYLCAKLNSPEANYKVSTGKIIIIIIIIIVAINVKCCRGSSMALLFCCFWYSFLLDAEPIPGPSVAGRIG
jgi:hypothetical protein